MNGLRFSRWTMCLLGLGLLACSAAGEAPAPGGGGDRRLELTPEASPTPSPSTSTSASATPEQPPVMAGGAQGGGSGAHCVCDVQHPDVVIDQLGGIIDITVKLPHARSIVIVTKTGSVKTSLAGIDIDGDVSVDLGSGSAVALLGAKLHLDSKVGGIPSLHGSAQISGSILKGIDCGCAEQLMPVSVRLNPDVDVAIPNSHASACLELSLKLPGLDLDTSKLPAAWGLLALADTDIVVTTDGCEEIMTASGDVCAKGEIWSSVLPLRAQGTLRATATLVDQALTRVELAGGVALVGTELACGLVPLLSVSLPDAKVTLDASGASVSASASASIHPGYLLTGVGKLTAKFEHDDWSINVCAATMTGLLGVHDCLNLSKDGVEACPQ